MRQYIAAVAPNGPGLPSDTTLTRRAKLLIDPSGQLLSRLDALTSPK
ncbi:MAG: hypothetical protein H7Z40_18950 [Phycisphaerae bacterium]|nr:hypothetical protein [Gemmatimonadaceae bacterium]